MKTVDLIPFILLELNDGDKYGIELTKAIETKTQGKVLIKQPTFYTVLKKLEKSKFISSYWEDSEIGGKRHYYKLTEYGKLQVSTLPPISELIKAAVEDTESDLVDENVNENETNAVEVNLQNVIEPKETILPTEVVFNEMNSNNLDNIPETEINLNNSQILKDDQINNEEVFASNTSVSKFTETNLNKSPLSDISSTKTIKHENKHESHLELTTSAQVFSSIENIQYVDYKNIKKDSQTIISKKLSKKLVAKSFIFSTCFIAILLTLNLITNHTGTSALYFTFWITGLLFAIFYPVILTLNLQNHIDKLYKTNLKAIHKKILFTNLCLTLLVIIVVLVANIVNGVTNISSIVHFNNFENFYAPIILISSSLLDGILFKIMFKK